MADQVEERGLALERGFERGEILRRDGVLHAAGKPFELRFDARSELGSRDQAALHVVQLTVLAHAHHGAHHQHRNQRQQRRSEDGEQLGAKGRLHGSSYSSESSRTPTSLVPPDT